MHKYNPQHIERLLSAKRRKEVNPLVVLKEAGLKSGDVFADVGCGPGFFSLPAAKVVGSSGVVYAVDTQKEMLRELRKRRPPGNVRVLRSGENSIPVDTSTVDFILLAYVLHETESKPRFLKELKRILKKGGTLLILDWKRRREEKGPPMEERLTIKAVRELLERAGFSRIRSSSLTPSHYKITAVK